MEYWRKYLYCLSQYMFRFFNVLTKGSRCTTGSVTCKPICARSICNQSCLRRTKEYFMSVHVLWNMFKRALTNFQLRLLLRWLSTFGVRKHRPIDVNVTKRNDICTKPNQMSSKIHQNVSNFVHTREQFGCYSTKPTSWIWQKIDTVLI